MSIFQRRHREMRQREELSEQGLGSRETVKYRVVARSNSGSKHIFWWKSVMSHEIRNMTEIYDTEWVGWVRIVSHELHVTWLCHVHILLSLMACHVVLSMVDFDQANRWFLLDERRWLIAVRCDYKRRNSQWRSTYLIFEFLMAFNMFLYRKVAGKIF